QHHRPHHVLRGRRGRGCLREGARPLRRHRRGHELHGLRPDRGHPVAGGLLAPSGPHAAHDRRHQRDVGRRAQPDRGEQGQDADPGQPAAAVRGIPTMAGAAPQEHTGKGGKKSLDAEINLVPFIDLLSCCISFLLITAVWTQIAGLQVASSGGPPEQQQKQENTIDVKLLLTEKGYSITMPGAQVDIPKIASADGQPAFDRKTLTEKLKTIKTRLPEQTAVTVEREDAVAYHDLVNTV